MNRTSSQTFRLDHVAEQVHSFDDVGKEPKEVNRLCPLAAQRGCEAHTKRNGSRSAELRADREEPLR